MIMVSKKTPPTDKSTVLKESFLEKELLHASVVQRELMGSIHELNTQMGTLNETLNLIREHAFVDLHKSKWRIVVYQILLGILFAIGTVMGLALISWSTYTFFKDNELLRQIVEKQLSNRNFNFDDIKNRAVRDATPVKVNTSDFGQPMVTGTGKLNK